jgi:predicted transcriptional regulator
MKRELLQMLCYLKYLNIMNKNNITPFIATHPGEMTKDELKERKMTQKQLAEKIGKKREYIAMLEKGETDMQLSTFIMISDAVGLKFALTY